MKYTKEQLEKLAKSLNLPKGACVCESKDGGILIDPKLNFVEAIILEMTLADYGKVQEIEDVRPLCSGNYVKVKK